MKQLHINTGYLVQSVIIDDDELAELAYKKLIGAMSEYKEFRNGHDQTVSFDTGPGCTSTYRVSNLVAVSMDDLDTAVAATTKALIAKRKVELEARLTVPYPRDSHDHED